MTSTAKNNYEATNQRNTRNLAVWTGSWVATLAITTFGSLLVWPEHTMLKTMLVVVNLLIGVGMIVANVRFVNGLDDLQKTIYLQSAGLSLGVTMICAISYTTLEQIGLISFRAEISHVVIVMGISFMIGQLFGTRYYNE